MSKASEWARQRPDDCEHGGQTIADVDEDGFCRLHGHSVPPVTILMSQARALILADWIKATFGDQP